MKATIVFKAGQEVAVKVDDAATATSCTRHDALIDAPLFKGPGRIYFHGSSVSYIITEE